MKNPYQYEPSTDSLGFDRALDAYRSGRDTAWRLWEILSKSIRAAYKDQLRRKIAPYRHIHRDDLADAINSDFTVALVKLKTNGRVGVDAKCFLLGPLKHSYKRLLRHCADDIVPPPWSGDAPIPRERGRVRCGPRRGEQTQYVSGLEYIPGVVQFAELYEIAEMYEEEGLSEKKKKQLDRIFRAVLPQMAEMAATDTEQYICRALLARKTPDQLLADRPGLTPGQVSAALERLDRRVAWRRYLDLVNVPVAA